MTPTRLDTALDMLRAQARPQVLAGMARFGMAIDGRLGLSMPAMRRVAKLLGRDHELALALWDTGIPDACIVAGMLAEPQRLGSRQMDAWAKSLRSWDVCDQVCGSAFLHSPLAWPKVAQWAGQRDEFVRRAGFALLATLAVHDRASDDARFVQALALVQAAAGDERNFVRKAVNWALRNIGKRNAALSAAAIQVAQQLRHHDSRAARWIAADALRELRSDAVQVRLRERAAKPPALER
jgi:3-methyladenine DNA glycosylase AlkD